MQDVPGGGQTQRRLVATGLILGAVAVILQSVLYALNVYGLDRSVAMFDLEEGELVTWATSSTTFSAAVLVLIAVFIDPRRSLPGVTLAAGLAFLSFDDALFLHERVAQRIADGLDASSSYVQVIWPVLYLPLLAALALLLLGSVRDSEPARRLVVTGLAMLAGAVILEVASHGLERVETDSDSWLWIFEISLEEGAELMGWILIVIAAALRLVTVARASGWDLEAAA